MIPRPIINAVVKAATEVVGAATEVASAETKVAANPLATEAAVTLSSPPAKSALAAPAIIGRETASEAGRATLTLNQTGKATLTLGDRFTPASGFKPQTTADTMRVTNQGGRTTRLVEIERVGTRLTERTPRTAANSNNIFQTESEAAAYIDQAVKNQGAVLRHNTITAEKSPEAIGKYAQLSIFNPLKTRFDMISKNPNMRLVATADGSATDLVGGDYVLFDRGTKNYWLLDSKPLFDQTKIVPTARSNGLLEYHSDWFKQTAKGWVHNPNHNEFRNFINAGANNLVRLGEKPSMFNLTRIPLPSILPGSPQEALVGIERFRNALLRSGDGHLNAYGQSLGGTLKFLNGPRAQFRL